MVGIVDGHGSSIVSYGKLDNGTGQEVNGNTVFEIGSITKVFTALLLQDMVERGQMKLDDPVSNYLPPSVKMPSRNGKEITLRQLATHMSGLPRDPNNERENDVWADYTVEQLYAFLSGYTLSRDPGAEWEYSNLGFGLLGHVIALKAGTNYESLVLNRICRPLGMDSTCITLTPGLKARLARGHTTSGKPVGNMDFQTLLGGGALRSTANDLLKFLSANLGLAPSGLTAVMQKTHQIQFENQALGWGLTGAVVWKNGGTYGYHSFVGFDKKQRRGVVILSNTRDDELDELGFLLLKSEWQSGQRPGAVKINPQIYGSYVGQYQMKRDFRLGILVIRALLNTHKTIAGIAIGVWLVLWLVLFRVFGSRKRWIFATSAVPITSLLFAFAAVALSRLVKAPALQAVASVSRQDDRLFVQITGQLKSELLPESETRFFERLSGIQMTFVRNFRGEATGIVVHSDGQDYSLAKISGQPLNAKGVSPRY